MGRLRRITIHSLVVCTYALGTLAMFLGMLASTFSLQLERWEGL